MLYAIGIPTEFYSPLGPVGAVLAIAVSNIPIWIVLAYALHCERLSVLVQDVVMTTLFAALLLSLIGGRNLFGLGLPFAGLL